MTAATASGAAPGDVDTVVLWRSYDDAGRITLAQAEGRIPTSFAYDAKGRLQSIEAPDNTQT